MNAKKKKAGHEVIRISRISVKTGFTFHTKSVQESLKIIYLKNVYYLNKNLNNQTIATITTYKKLYINNAADYEIRFSRTKVQICRKT